MTEAFKLSNVTKHYGDIKALEGITLSANEGQILGLLGPNGAGKTTIVKILSTLTKPTSGHAEVYGINVVKDPDSVRRLIGLAGQYAAIDEFQTGYENIYMTGRLYGLSSQETKKRTLELLDQFSLTDAAKRIVNTYSGGMRRRLDLGASLIGHPKILFLDEPTTGLDPKTRLDLWKIIQQLVKDGTTILLTTQYLEEADELANFIAIVNHGKIVAEGTADQLKNRLGNDVVECQLQNIKDKDLAISVIKKIAKYPPEFNDTSLKMTIPVNHGAKDLMKIVELLNSSKILIEELSLHRPSLDDVFLTLTKSNT